MTTPHAHDSSGQGQGDGNGAGGQDPNANAANQTAAGASQGSGSSTLNTGTGVGSGLNTSLNISTTAVEAYNKLFGDSLDEGLIADLRDGKVNGDELLDALRQITGELEVLKDGFPITTGSVANLTDAVEILRASPAAWDFHPREQAADRKKVLDGAIKAAGDLVSAAHTAAKEEFLENYAHKQINAAADRDTGKKLYTDERVELLKDFASQLADAYFSANPKEKQGARTSASRDLEAEFNARAQELQDQFAAKAEELSEALDGKLLVNGLQRSIRTCCEQAAEVARDHKLHIMRAGLKTFDTESKSHFEEFRSGFVRAVRDAVPPAIEQKLQKIIDDAPLDKREEKKKEVEAMRDSLAGALLRSQLGQPDLKGNDLDNFHSKLDERLKGALAIERLHYGVDPYDAAGDLKETVIDSTEVLDDTYHTKLRQAERYALAKKLNNPNPDIDNPNAETPLEEFGKLINALELDPKLKTFLVDELVDKPKLLEAGQRPRPWQFEPANEADFRRGMMRSSGGDLDTYPALESIFTAADTSLQKAIEGSDEIKAVLSRFGTLAQTVKKFQDLCSPLESGGSHYEQRQEALEMMKSINGQSEMLARVLPEFGRSLEEHDGVGGYTGDPTMRNHDVHRMVKELNEFLIYSKGQANERLAALKEFVGSERMERVNEMFDAKAHLDAAFEMDGKWLYAKPEAGFGNAEQWIDLEAQKTGFDDFAIKFEKKLYGPEKPTREEMSELQDEFSKAREEIKGFIDGMVQHDPGFQGLSDPEKASRERKMREAYAGFVERAEKAFGNTVALERPAEVDFSASSPENPSGGDSAVAPASVSVSEPAPDAPESTEAEQPLDTFGARAGRFIGRFNLRRRRG